MLADRAWILHPTDEVPVVIDVRGVIERLRSQVDLGVQIDQTTTEITKGPPVVFRVVRPADDFTSAIHAARGTPQPTKGSNHGELIAGIVGTPDQSPSTGIVPLLVPERFGDACCAKPRLGVAQSYV